MRNLTTNNYLINDLMKQPNSPRLFTSSTILKNRSEGYMQNYITPIYSGARQLSTGQLGTEGQLGV